MLSSPVLREFTALAEPLSAAINAADKRFFTGVHEQVFLEVLQEEELFSAVLADVLGLGGKQHLVPLQTERGTKAFIAVVAI